MPRGRIHQSMLRSMLKREPHPNPNPEPEPEPQQNHLLASLSPAAQYRLFPHLELATLGFQSVINEAGLPMRHVYFPTDSIISMQYLLQDGGSAAIAVVGREGLLGITQFLGCQMQCRSVVQSAGHAFRLPNAQLKEEFGRNGEFQELMLRYTQALIAQVGQTAACNRFHSIDQQVCRWLLLSMDRVSHNKLGMTQEFISNMLGVRREGVTEAAIKLRKMGIIAYNRGVITVLDRPRLELAACECYDVVRSATERILQYLPAPSTITPSKTPVIH